MVLCRNNFEKGMRDEFTVETADVGKMLKLQIGHDNKWVAAYYGFGK